MIKFKNILKELLKNDVNKYAHAPDEYVWFHGSQDDDIESLQSSVPPYEGGLGGGIYVTGNKDHAEIYGKYIYAVHVDLKEDEVFWLTQDSDVYLGVIEGREGYSILQGESIDPFMFKVGDQIYAVTGGSYPEDEDIMSMWAPKFLDAVAEKSIELADWLEQRFIEPDNWRDKWTAIPDTEYDIDDVKDTMYSELYIKHYDDATDSYPQKVIDKVDELIEIFVWAIEKTEQEQGESQIIQIGLSDIGDVVEEADYKAVFFDGFRGGIYARSQDELLVFDANDVKIIGMAGDDYD